MTYNEAETRYFLIDPVLRETRDTMIISG